MERIDTAWNLAERRISVWIRIHERLQDEQRRRESQRVPLPGIEDGEKAAA